MWPHEPRPPRQNFGTHVEISQSHLEIKSLKLCFTCWALFTVKWSPLPLGQVVQNLFIAGFDFGQPRHCQNIFQLDLYKRHNSLFLSFRKMVCNVFWTASAYNYAQFHCLDLHLSLADFKICLKILSGWPPFIWSHCNSERLNGLSHCVIIYLKHMATL